MHHSRANTHICFLRRATFCWCVHSMCMCFRTKPKRDQLGVAGIRELLKLLNGCGWRERDRRGDSYQQRKGAERKNRVVFISINNSGCVLSPVVCSCKLHASAIFTAANNPTHTNAHTNGRISKCLCHSAHRHVIYVKMGFSL